MDNSLLKKVTIFIVLFVFIYFSVYQMIMKGSLESNQPVADSSVDEVDENAVS